MQYIQGWIDAGLYLNPISDDPHYLKGFEAHYRAMESNASDRR